MAMSDSGSPPHKGLGSQLIVTLTNDQSTTLWFEGWATCPGHATTGSYMRNTVISYRKYKYAGALCTKTVWADVIVDVIGDRAGARDAPTSIVRRFEFGN